MGGGGGWGWEWGGGGWGGGIGYLTERGFLHKTAMRPIATLPSCSVFSLFPLAVLLLLGSGPLARRLTLSRCPSLPPPTTPLSLYSITFPFLSLSLFLSLCYLNFPLLLISLSLSLSLPLPIPPPPVRYPLLSLGALSSHKWFLIASNGDELIVV